MLTVQHIRKSFGKYKVLNDVNFEVQEGSIFGLVGTNGAGKSTLLRVLAGIYEPDSGNCYFCGKDSFSQDEIRKDIFYVSDEPYYPFGATIESLKIFYASFYALDNEIFEKYLHLFALPPKKSITNFSKGMKRQTSLLFALAIRPRLLLLDEAFDGLDPLVRLHFKRALAELLESGISVIISSHNLKELEDICDAYGILEAGKVSTYGDLLQSKQNINKYQIAFHEEKQAADFFDFSVLHYEKEGQVYTLVIRGEKEEILTKLQAMNPLLCNALPVNFEELFIYEIESRGKIHE